MVPSWIVGVLVIMCLRSGYDFVLSKARLIAAASFFVCVGYLSTSSRISKPTGRLEMLLGLFAPTSEIVLVRICISIALYWCFFHGFSFFNCSLLSIIVCSRV